MDYNMKSMSEIIEIKQIVSDRMNCSAERWLDIAFKLDYITLSEKEKISELVVKYEDVVCHKIRYKFFKKNYYLQ